MLLQISLAFLAVAGIFYFLNIGCWLQRKIKKSSRRPSSIGGPGVIFAAVGIALFPYLGIIEKLLLIASLFLFEKLVAGNWAVTSLREMKLYSRMLAVYDSGLKDAHLLKEQGVKLINMTGEIIRIDRDEKGEPLRFKIKGSDIIFSILGRQKFYQLNKTAVIKYVINKDAIKVLKIRIEK